MSHLDATQLTILLYTTFLREIPHYADITSKDMLILPLKDLGCLFQGLTVSRYVVPSGKKEKVVQIRDLDYYYVNSELESLNLDAPNLERYRLVPNDLVLTIRGTTKKASIITSDTKNSIVGQNLAVFRPIAEKINPLYLVVLLRSKWLEESLSRLYGQSTGTRSVSLTKLCQLEIPVLDLEIQTKVAELFLATEEMRIASLKSIEARQQIAELSLYELLGKSD